MTIFGEDSGAASVPLLSMIPTATGLFQGVIALSGNALCDQFLQSDPVAVGKDLAARLDCSTAVQQQYWSGSCRSQILLVPRPSP